MNCFETITDDSIAGRWMIELAGAVATLVTAKPAPSIEQLREIQKWLTAMRETIEDRITERNHETPHA